jgi:AbrB family looped-hinge helix DNA binding protein
VAITRKTTNRHRARITSQGQITIPKAIRDRLGVKPGDDVEFESGRHGTVIRPRPRRSVLDFAGIAADTVIGFPMDPVKLKQVISQDRERVVAAKMERIAVGKRSKT